MKLAQQDEIGRGSTPINADLRESALISDELLRAVQIKTAVTALKRRWRVFALTSLLVLTLILLSSILFVIPGLIVAVVFGLYAPVAIMEQHGVRGTLRRSRILSRRALGTVLVITLVQFALPV